MSARAPLLRIVALALLSIGGLVGMLVTATAWDWAFLSLSVLPISIGIWRLWVQRRSTGRPLRQ